MQLSQDIKYEIRRTYRTLDQIQKEIVSAGAMAAMCAEKGQIAGVVYWQSCATFLRELAQEKLRVDRP
jgi:hypothetical protein